MKILHVSTGHGIYDCLHLALLEKGIDSQELTLYSEDYIENTEVFQMSAFSKRKCHYQQSVENFTKKRIYNISHDVEFSLGYAGYNITKHKWVKEADIIHLNWTTGNWLSVNNIGQLLKLNKPIVWTLHDVWGLTGGCHVLLNDCDKWKNMCGNCPFLKKGNNYRDVSYFLMKQKAYFFNNSNLSLVAPSNWMFRNIQDSKLFCKSKVFHIPNMLKSEELDCYDMKVVEENLSYHKENEISVLYGATMGITRAYKGFQYIREALAIIQMKFPDIADRLVIHLFGENNIEMNDFLGYKVINWGMQTGNRLIYLYNLADIYLYPSIADNLPGTVMESLACSTPVVCFNIGGIPDIVIHKQSGYIAQKEDILDFVKGIIWILENNKNNVLGTFGYKFVHKNFNKHKIVNEHIKMYESLLHT